MAVGILFFAATPGYTDPMTYLFGNILLVSSGDLQLVAALDVLVAGVGLVFYHKFQAICFDQEFAELRGVQVKAYYLLLLCLTALTVVLLVPPGGHRDGRGPVDAAGGRGELLLPSALADDALGHRGLCRVDRRWNGRQLPL